MKILLVLLVLLIASPLMAAEWLVCDPPPETDEVVEAVVIVDGTKHVIPITLSTDGSAVLLWEITEMDTGSFEVRFINIQGRRSNFVPFVLKPKPSSAENFRIIEE